MIKWSKLYVDDFQSSWTMPKREKGFYHAWQRLVKHDAIHKKQRLTLVHLPNQATEAIEYVFQELGVKKNIDNHILRVIYYLYQVGRESCIIGHRHIVMMITY